MKDFHVVSMHDIDEGALAAMCLAADCIVGYDSTRKCLIGYDEERLDTVAVVRATGPTRLMLARVTFVGIHGMLAWRECLAVAVGDRHGAPLSSLVKKRFKELSKA